MLDLLLDEGLLESLDVHFARTLQRLGGASDPLVGLGAALASAAPRLGDVCVDLPDLTSGPPLNPDGEAIDAKWPELDGWLEALRASPLTQGDSSPLVLDEHGGLYTRRYWRYQMALVRAVKQRADAQVAKVHLEALKTGLDRMFQTEGRDLQRLAAAVAVFRKLAVITGGPGTGKTTTVVRILALLQEQAAALGHNALRVVLLAPTGKAAARMGEAIQQQLDDLELPEAIRRTLPTSASTIHRALGWQPRTPTRFRHSRQDPLPADVVIVDEASMVDLALMTKLLDAVPDNARLVLLGDKDQLASVEAGAILGDLCHRHDGAFSQGFRDQLLDCVPFDLEPSTHPEPGIWDCIVELDRSWRFEKSPGIGALARSVNAGHAEQALQALAEHDEIEQILPQGDAPPETLIGDRLRSAYAEYLVNQDPMQVLAAFNRFRVLCAHRRGAYGAEHMNRVVRTELARVGIVPGSGDWYHGRPVMVTRNDYGLNLFNGDVGICLIEGRDAMRVWFAGPDGRPRGLHPARLPAHETVFAMTVHKSQGSEFDEVLLVLPPTASPILTRELIYTGVTRARSRVSILADEELLTLATRQRIQRSSGLRRALWGAE